MRLPYFIYLSALSFSIQAADIKPFKSDGCSAFPDGTLEQHQLWLRCCHAHDLAYWRGGSYQEREQADLTLQACVASVSDATLAALMLTGVRIGGSPYLPFTFRWGYGWPWPRGYKPLTANELAQIEASLKNQPTYLNPPEKQIHNKKQDPYNETLYR